MLSNDEVLYVMGVLSKHYGTHTISTLDRRKTIDILNKLMGANSPQHITVNTLQGETNGNSRTKTTQGIHPHS